MHIKGLFSSIVVKNSEVWINGKRVDLPKDEKEINIVVEGNCEKIEVDALNKLEIKGDAGSVRTVSGDVHCRDIKGSVETVSGDVYTSKVFGGVQTVSGDVGC